MKVLFITNIPSPYRVDFFNELGKYCRLTVAFERASAKDRNKDWKSEVFSGFDAIFIKGIEIGTDASLSVHIISVIKAGYDIIILGGYSSPTYWIAMEYMRARKIPFVLNADGGFVKKDWKLVYCLKRHLISRASAWLSTGRLTDTYLTYYGADIDKIYRYPFTSVKVQECFFPSSEEKKANKQLLGMKEQTNIITVGQFIPRKGFDLLIRCAAQLEPGISVYIIGGEPGDEYYKLIKETGVDNIHFEGFKNHAELRKYYIAADIFVFPTREDIWGLVLNEAMAYGLPCIASRQAIASCEMIEDGKNGYLVDPEDIDRMAEMLNYLANHKEEGIRVGKEALKKAEEYTIERMALRHMDIFEELTQ